jgi:hypothetical protein
MFDRCMVTKIGAFGNNRVLYNPPKCDQALNDATSGQLASASGHCGK